jgi:hypothetical protein
MPTPSVTAGPRHDPRQDFSDRPFLACHPERSQRTPILFLGLALSGRGRRESSSVGCGSKFQIPAPSFLASSRPKRRDPGPFSSPPGAGEGHLRRECPMRRMIAPLRHLGRSLLCAIPSAAEEPRILLDAKHFNFAEGSRSRVRERRSHPDIFLSLNLLGVGKIRCRR